MQDKSLVKPSIAVLVASAAVATILASCGGGSPVLTTPTTTPTPVPQAVRTVIDDFNFQSLKANTTIYHNVDRVPDGTIDATLDWSGATSEIDVFVTNNSCSGSNDAQSGACPNLARAVGAAKPKKVSFKSEGGKTYTFWIVNAGRLPDSGVMETALTRAGGLPTPAPPVPGATPTPTSSIDPTLAQGPVAKYTIKVRSIDTGNFNYRDPFQDADGNWIVHPKEFVVFDSTQKNAADQLCTWVHDPEWSVTDKDGVLVVLGSSQPFLLRADVSNKGTATLQAEIDGVKSNVLTVVSK